jgi:hypothetical protein
MLEEVYLGPWIFVSPQHPRHQPRNLSIWEEEARLSTQSPLPAISVVCVSGSIAGPGVMAVHVSDAARKAIYYQSAQEHLCGRSAAIGNTRTIVPHFIKFEASRDPILRKTMSALVKRRKFPGYCRQPPSSVSPRCFRIVSKSSERANKGILLGIWSSGAQDCGTRILRHDQIISRVSSPF